MKTKRFAEPELELLRLVGSESILTDSEGGSQPIDTPTLMSIPGVPTDVTDGQGGGDPSSLVPNSGSAPNGGSEVVP